MENQLQELLKSQNELMAKIEKLISESEARIAEIEFQLK